MDVDVVTVLADLHDDIQTGKPTCRHFPTVNIREQSIWPNGWATLVARLLWRLDTEAARRRTQVELTVDGQYKLEVATYTSDPDAASWLEPIICHYIHESVHRCRVCGSMRKHLDWKIDNKIRKVFLSYSHDCEIHHKSRDRLICDSPPQVSRHALLAVQASPEAAGAWRVAETLLGAAWRLPITEGAREGFVTVYADVGRPYAVVEFVADAGAPLDGAGALPEQEAELAACISRCLGLPTVA